MNKLDTIIAFIALGISTTILFQNCSAPNSKNKTSSFQVLGEDAQNSENDFLIPPAENTEPEVIPAGPIMNRNLALDNKVIFGNTEFSIGGSGDTFTYETTYLAQSLSTFARIQDATNGIALVVESDQCSGQKNLPVSEFDIFKALFEEIYPSSSERILVGSETQESNCSFPRLVMSAAAPQLNDLEIYFSTRECTPEGDLYLDDVNSDGRDDLLRAGIDAFFKGHINDVCGL